MTAPLCRLLLSVGLLVGIWMFAPTATAFAGPPSIADLISGNAQFNGRTVSFRGEVIGDVMVRGRFAWVNMSDGSATIGVWLPVQQARAIENTGGYSRKGDVVQVTGRFNKACPQHGGDLDVHATQFAVVERGGPIAHNAETGKVIAAAILLPLGFGLLWITRHRHLR